MRTRRNLGRRRVGQLRRFQVCCRRGLRLLESVAGPRFRRSVVLHLGDAVVPFDPRLYAVPMPELLAG